MSGAGLRGRSILLVEDEFLVAAMLADALEEAGATVVGPAGSVAEGLRLVGRGGFDLAVIDWNLDGNSGEPVACALAEAGVPFVIASGYGSIAGRFADATLLAKPFAPARLVAALEDLI